MSHPIAKSIDPRMPPSAPQVEKPVDGPVPPKEIGGRRADVSKGLEPTRYGDWEKNGRCIDF